MILDIMFWIWLAVCVLMVIVEACTAMLVSIWFVGGGVAALVACLCNGPVWLQLVLFVVVSAALLLLLRPFLQKQTNPHKSKTNVDAEIGKKAVVTQTIDNLHGTGRIQVGSVDWTASSLNETVIEVGSLVVIRKIEGVRAYVELAGEPAAVG